MKRLMTVLIAASAMTFGCNRNPTAPTSTEPAATPAANSKTTAAAGSPSKVTILFTGLMVFHQERGKSYEVGILPATTHNFVFRVVGPGPAITQPKGRTWTLDVTQPTVTGPIAPRRKGHPLGRRPDDDTGSEDFDWIIDLDGRDFHGPSLEMTKNKLNPIIHLPNAELYTKYKSLDLVRCQGGRGCAGSAGGGSSSRSDFGFVPESIAMDLTLVGDQELILKDDASGTSQVLAKSTPGLQLVIISNVGSTSMKESDFHLYYDLLFQKVADQDKYDFDARNPVQYLPYNPSPALQHNTVGLGMLTCCYLECTSVFLSQRAAPLD